jgi:hypothetical protein
MQDNAAAEKKVDNLLVAKGALDPQTSSRLLG